MRRLFTRGLGTLTAMLIAAGIFTAAPTSAQVTATGRPMLGAQFHAIWGDYDDADRIKDLDMLDAAGVEWVRIDVGWNGIEQNGPGDINNWYLGRVEHAVDSARARGINVLMTLWLTPRWANGGASDRTPPDNASDYGRFAGWMADHFRGRVQAWEVWNEPNLDDMWTGTYGKYVSLVKAAYGPIKQSDPNAVVVAGSVAHNDTDALSKMYANGMAGHYDALSTHPYQGQQDLPPEEPDNTGDKWWLLSHVASVHELMQSYGDGAKPIWFTEYGWSAHPNSGGEDPWELGVSEQKQGEYMIRAIEFVKANYPYVENMIWYNSRRKATGDLHQDGFGLMNRDFTPRPAYRDLQAYTQDGTVSDPAPSRPGPEECTIRGTRGDDVLVGTRGRDVICGGGGNDVIRARGGNDLIRAGGGRDLIVAGPGRDVIVGGRGRDRVYGGGGKDVLRGGGGRDILAGNAGRNKLFGGAGRDVCRVTRGDLHRACWRT